jgi:phosphatidylethanolamine-binding protein (PEBP) family uncharacterized protein
VPDMSIVGRALRGLRSDASRSPLATSAFEAPTTIIVSSPAFADGAPIPRRHAGRGVGDNLSPELRWQGVPAGTVGLVLLLDDLDVPLRRPLFHNAAVLEPQLDGLAEGEFGDGTAGLRNIPTMLSKTGYAGPRPIPGHGPHRYRFHVLASSQQVPADVRTVKAVLAALADRVTARGTQTGAYQR